MYIYWRNKYMFSGMKWFSIASISRILGTVMRMLLQVP